MNFDFTLILFWLMAGTGVIWIADLAFFRRQRRTAAEAAARDFDAQAYLRTGMDQEAVRREREHLLEKHLRQPAWIEFSAGFFPVIVLVFGLRSFLFEPFRIPSGSMIPTLLVGDLILANKYAYGIRLPVLNRKIMDVGNPQRGDVMVFRYPSDPSLNYIKRVIGLPGDRITYRNKRLEINGQEVAVNRLPDYLDEERVFWSAQYEERLPSTAGFVAHRILNYEDRSPMMMPEDFRYKENCRYSVDRTALTCLVPDGHYFVMGDNRDNSQDSRYWGFVPDENIVGKAFFIWMNFGNIGRIGSFH